MRGWSHHLLAEVNAEGLLNLLVAYRWWILYAVVVLVAIYAVQRAVLGILRAIRRSRPAVIHPRLQKYNVDLEELDRRRHELAKGIVATSTGNRLAGFRVVRQVEAVVVEGYRSPEEAIVALKATAVERGANAVLNVHTERTAAGRCTASGDAIIAAPLQPPVRKQGFAPPAPPPADKSG